MPQHKFIYDEKKGIKFREQNGITQDDLLILNVAQITPRKGIYDFMK